MRGGWGVRPVWSGPFIDGVVREGLLFLFGTFVRTFVRNLRTVRIVRIAMNGGPRPRKSGIMKVPITGANRWTSVKNRTGGRFGWFFFASWVLLLDLVRSSTGLGKLLVCEVVSVCSG